MYKRFGKRAFDVVLVACFSPLILVLCAVVALTVYLRMGRPVLLRQVRPGLHEKPFSLLKFRTMTNDCDEKGELLPDAKRLTSFGRWLRSTSLDELPELWNVLAGEMSLVGPRPLLAKYLERYEPHERKRHKVLPGITGWAQVSGRNSHSWEERFAADLWYVEKQGLLLDLKILLKTAAVVCKRQGISHMSDPTMPEYKGHNSRQQGLGPE